MLVVGICFKKKGNNKISNYENPFKAQFDKCRLKTNLLVVSVYLKKHCNSSLFQINTYIKSHILENYDPFFDNTG